MMKSYNKSFLLAAGLFLLLCVAVTCWVQPISNDLTRIGAYPERWFGWNKPQRQPPTLKESPPETGKRKILVVGDSFSASGYWQPYLSDKYSFSYVYIRHIGFDGMLKKIAAEKPDAVVLQSIERDLVDIFGMKEKLGSGSSHCSYPATVADNDISATQLGYALQQLPVFPDVARSRWPSSLNHLSQGAYYLKSWLKILVHPDSRKTRLLALNNTHLFSNARSHQLLVLSGDALLQKPFSTEEIKTVQCGMQQVDDALSALGIPHVILLVPDKTSAYQPYLEDAELRNKPTLVDQVHVGRLSHGINMLPTLHDSLESGQQDLYLPSDTHWGYAGYQIAAALVDHELSMQWYDP